jgi:PAS domain S-box-containing protein
MPVNVLLIEDSPTQAEALRGLLESASYDVRLATSGESGLAMFDAGSFDMVISDIVMPGPIDGYELCRRIKSGRRRSTPVVLLTSLGDSLDIIHGLEAGADNFVTKPYESAHLLERLAVLLKTREVRSDRGLRAGTDVFFMGRRFTITSEREQILDLLISTFEDAVRQNRQLRRREEELEAARAELARYAEGLEVRLHSVLNSIPDALFSMSADRKSVYYVSPAGRTVFGREPEQITFEYWESGVHPADLDAARGAMTAAVATGNSQTFDYRFDAGDNAIRWISQIVVPVRDSHGCVVRLDGTARDITEQRLLEEQFRQAQKMESVGRIAGGVAHDFNNLLTVIIGEADAAQTMMHTDAIATSIQEIRSAADRAAGLTRRLLAFSRQNVSDPTIFNANGLVNEMSTMLGRLIGEDIEVITRRGDDLGLVRTDRGQLEQVLMNLVVNARDAMPEGGRLTIETANVTLGPDYVRTHADVSPGEHVLLAVSDSGTGITTETQAHMFEPFFTTKEPGKGTGLGLATCYGIVKQSGGHIEVYSELGLGTTMKVYLPRVHGTADLVATAVPAKASGGGERILLVEDDLAVRDLSARMLTSFGYKVVKAARGRDALDVLRQSSEHIDLLLTDVVLPEMAGREVADRARALRPGMKVLFISGYTNDVTLQHKLLDNGAMFLEKPYTAAALTGKVRELLDAT